MVLRATQRIGEERLAQRDLLVETWDELPLAERGRSPLADVPELAVVMTDGGRVQVLPAEDVTEGETPQNDPASLAAPDEPTAFEGQADTRRRGRFWRENKVAALMSMSSESRESDPCPELPEVFSDPLVVLKLAREVGHAEAIPPAEPFQSPGSQQDRQGEQADQEREQKQRRVKGTEKFWSEEGVEAVMQLRADYLSDDEPMEQFWQQRADRMTGQRTYKQRSA